MSCENCGVNHGPDDIFCENCGYDFITGSLPGPNEQFSPPAAAQSPEERFGGALFPDPPAVPGAPASARALTEQVTISVRVEISADQAYYASVVAEGELSFPQSIPPPVHVDLVGTEIHIGRASDSRAIHPDIDVADLTGDPAVSSRHAVVRGTADGTMTVTDVGSTNGTYVNSFSGSSIGVGQPIVIGPGVDVYVGAWTRLRFSPNP
ncbi:MAG: FHA domain-containing protein [Actinomycetia bacterium]|nr:FHA domain-containing protein [Actinomycetes bacterium]